ncbi:hypothetical protein [Massilia sp. PWRC2]|uniref:hypothetical protein n=1 Tax=Massilia sp. PWRC2 TaxID=2804626 RepID=UPI003CFAEF54
MTTFGFDTPMERPRAGGRAAVFVPDPNAVEAVREALRNGSGMVGFGNPDRTVTIYFENNRFNDPALQPWQAKTFKSYSRMVELSPTVNKLTCAGENVVQIGFIEGSEILVRDMAKLRAWLTISGAADSMPDSAEIHA